MLFRLSISNFNKLLLLFWITVSSFFSCSKKENSIGDEFKDNFDRKYLGSQYFDTIGRYIVANSALNIHGGFNHPLWLRKSLPVNIDIEMDVKSLSKDGDIKIELFGDGKSFALNKGAYVGTGYIFCMGAWKNSKTFIAKRFEHDKRLLQTTKFKVSPGKTHHWKIVSRLKKGILYFTWFIDNKVALKMKDKTPLYGKNNQWFGFSNWNSDVWFDNLKITRRTVLK